ncbi:MAG: hypothetical protein SFW35_10475 [Chitinophagales bacterium]|nr:hypothetical protein [Chitinophagales bacterium]
MYLQLSKYSFHTLLFSLFFIPSVLFAQDKDLAKADEYLKKAVTLTGTEKNELLKKAIELYTKVGKTKEEMYTTIGDALVDARDYNGATTYYTRGGTAVKKQGQIRIAEEYMENASEDAKNESKLIKKALDAYVKGGASKDGYKTVGDYYSAKGPEYDSLAFSYYEQGQVTEKLTEIGDNYYSKGPEYYAKAAEAYEKTGSPEGTKKAGDIYWGLGEKDVAFYEKAYTAYDKGHHMDGIKKYADRLFEMGQEDAANAQYNKIADYYVSTKNSGGLDKLASAAFDGGNYQLASMYYEKMADTKNMEKAQSYDALYKFDFAGAIDHFTKAEDMAMANAIKANLKTLETLPQIYNDLEEIKKTEPFVGMDSNAVLGKKVPNAQDQANFNAYYKSVQGTIADNVYKVSAAYQKLTDPTLKKVVKLKFQRFNAFKTILNPDTFVKKKEKAALKLEDVIL